MHRFLPKRPSADWPDAPFITPLAARSRQPHRSHGAGGGAVEPAAGPGHSAVSGAVEARPLVGDGEAVQVVGERDRLERWPRGGRKVRPGRAAVVRAEDLALCEASDRPAVLGVDEGKAPQRGQVARGEALLPRPTTIRRTQNAGVVADGEAEI